MAISLKTSGSWVENVAATPTVTLVGSPAAGDRYYVWTAYKTFSITTSMPAGWNKVKEFTDGAVATGVGTGSMKVACWYRDWVSGDANPTLTFSTATNLLSQIVCQLWQKAATETWGTPTFVTAAWPSQSTGAVNASSIASTHNGSVVMGLIAICDDTATFTRTTASISNASTTWNGNYVESPATHASTITGNDMSCDLGHRFVTTGALATTLVIEATLAAADTGAIMWVIQPLAGPAVRTLSDNFATQDTAKWTFSGTSATGGQLSIPADGSFFSNISKILYNLTDSSVVVEVPQAANGATGNVGTTLHLRYPQDNNNQIWIQAGLGNLRTYQTVASAEVNGVEVTYSATTHRWWRIRESGGTAFLDASPNGVSWTNVNSFTIGVAITNLEVALEAYSFIGSFTALLDNFNNAPPVPVMCNNLSVAVNRATSR